METHIVENGLPVSSVDITLVVCTQACSGAGPHEFGREFFIVWGIFHRVPTL